MGQFLLSLRRPHFVLRLMVPLLVALAAVGLVQYSVVHGTVRDEIVSEAFAIHEADARSIETIHAQVTPGEVVKNDINRYLRAIAARPGNDDVVLLDDSGRMIYGDTLLGQGLPFKGRRARQATRAGSAYAGEDDDFGAGKGHFVYVAPVTLPEGRFALVLRQRERVLEQRLAEIRKGTLLVLLLGLAIAVPAFFLVGGRRLVRLHRTAVERSTRDGLTDLGNHRAFQEEMEAAVSLARRRARPLTLAVIDVDDFKFENDRHGHRHGDRLLTRVAAAFEDVRAYDRAFRVGGDEFAVIFPDADDSSATAALERARAAIEADARVTVSVGVACAAPGTADAEGLRDEADAALYEAKRSGGDRLVSFREIEGQSRVVTAEKVRAVRRLLDEGRMCAAFQPIWDLERCAMLGVEALARPAEDYGFAGPGEAFAVADAIGHGPDLDELCRRTILEQVDELPEGALLFINVSPASLDVERLDGELLVRMASAAGLAPERVVLEVTERFSGRTERVIREATRLRELGFKLALDDVGAGNSGLEMLRDLPVEFVKIDREVVVSALAQGGARAVLVSIMAFARQTGAYVIAEGIETQEMLQLVSEPAATAAALPAAQGAQGYLLGRPGTMPDDLSPPEPLTGPSRVEATV